MRVELWSFRRGTGRTRAGTGSASRWSLVLGGASTRIHTLSGSGIPETKPFPITEWWVYENHEGYQRVFNDLFLEIR